MAQFDQPPPKQATLDEDVSIEARQFNPPPPKQPLIDDEEPEFMAPKINEEGLYQVDDMIFLKGQYQYHYGNETEQRQAISSATARWKKKKMYYAYDNSVSSSQRYTIHNALKELNNALDGCINVQ